MGGKGSSVRSNRVDYTPEPFPTLNQLAAAHRALFSPRLVLPIIRLQRINNPDRTTFAIRLLAENDREWWGWLPGAGVESPAKKFEKRKYREVNRVP